MTDLQVLRNSLFDEIKKIKRGTADIDETNAIVKTSNAIVSTYQLELKNAELILNASEKGLNVKEVTIFDNSEKNEIEYLTNEKIM